MKTWWQSLRLLACCAVAVAAGLPAAGSQHVRVVLDTSGSMATNDPPRLTILATLLLHDLADLGRNLGDSFEVLPFDPTAEWRDPAAAPPLAVGPRVRARFGARDALVAEISSLQYNARNTYFYPGLRAAITDLEQGTSRDVRALVLVTDGVPVEATREAELALIQRELLPRLQTGGIRLYVLAFGPEATTHRAFFESLLGGHGQRAPGQLFVDRDGSELLATMSEIFAQGFGYTRSHPQALAGGSDLDLEGGGKAQRSAVVVSSPHGGAIPSLNLVPPAGGSVNAPGGVVGAATNGASYALTWALSPHPGRYRASSSAAAARVVVLRPSRLALEVQSSTPSTQARQVMARTPVPWLVVARPEGGTGDPGPVNISFRTHGPRRTQPGPDASLYEWSSEAGAPAAGSDQSLPEGRSFPVEVSFPRDPQEGEASYRGYLEVEAWRGEARVGGLTGEKAYPVDVFPFLDITPSPLAGDALPAGDRKRRPRALRSGERGCALFHLRLTSGRLPHLKQPRYSLRATLDRSTQAFQGELAGALVTLDGKSLGVEGQASAVPYPWQLGQELSQADLLGEHAICLQVGRPKAGDPDKALELPLRLTLLESPYDSAPVIEPFTFRVWISPPTLVERIGPWLGLAFAVLCGVLGLAILRWRSSLPQDLAYALQRDEPGGSLPQATWAELTFERPPGLARWLGLAPALPVLALGEGRPLAWVRPAKVELFHLQPADGVRVEDPTGQALATARGGRYTLEVHRGYRLLAGGERYLLRLEYR